MLLFPQCFKYESFSSKTTLRKNLMKALWEKEKMLVTFSPLPTMFSTLSNTNFNFKLRFILLSANPLNLDKSKIFVIWYRVNPFPNKPWLLRVCRTSLLKTLWEKEKLLVTSNFSFSHSVFYPFGELSTIFMEVRMVV